MSRVMVLERSVVIFSTDEDNSPSRWYSAGLVDVEVYPELEPYCVPLEPQPVEPR